MYLELEFIATLEKLETYTRRHMSQNGIHFHKVFKFWC